MTYQQAEVTKSGSWLRDTVIVVLIVMGMLASIETLVRLAAPESKTTIYADGIPLARKDPTLGYLNNPGAVAHVAGPEFTVDYRISEQGFRDPAVHPPRAAPGEVRILLLGDSYTFGHGVKYEESWPALIRDRFRRDGKSVEIINAGVPGYSTTQQTLYLERLLDQFEPDIVVINFVAHDVVTNRPIEEAGAVATIAEGAAVTAGREKKSMFQSVSFLKRLLSSNDYLYTQVYVSTDRRKWYEAPPSDWLAGQIDTTKKLLSRAALLSRQKKARLVVLSTPQLFQVLAKANGTDIEGIDVNYVDDVFSDLARKEGFEWVPTLSHLAARYAEDDEDLYFRVDGHLNATGNAAFADISYGALLAAVEQVASD